MVIGKNNFGGKSVGRPNSWGRGRMPMQPGGGSQFGEPIASPLERLRAFYKMQYESGGQIGGLASSEPPTHQVQQARRATEMMKKNPVYQAKRRAWDTEQALAIVKEREALQEAAMAYDDMSPGERRGLSPELTSRIKEVKSKSTMDKSRASTLKTLAALRQSQVARIQASIMQLSEQMNRTGDMPVVDYPGGKQDQAKKIHRW